jgi:hypothetical protein
VTELERKAAENLWQAESLRASGRMRLIPWEEEGESERERFLGYAQCAFATLDAEGMVVVPKEPTEAMLKEAAIEAQRPAGWHMVYRNIYRAMLSALSGGREA